ncbi:MAG: NnrU family protein [Paracoccaceae bacterium]
MTGWTEFILAFAAFLGSHAIPARPRLRGWLIARMGRAGYVAVFSTLSTALLFWLIFAAGRAPFVPLWDQAPWQRWFVNLAVPLAIMLGTFGIGAPNPFAFEGRDTGYDPRRPGIVGLVRQPLLWALLLWAGAHLLVNGDLAHVILFGSFAAFALIGMAMLERRKRRQWGDDEFRRLAAHSSPIPFAALLAGRWCPSSGPSLIRLGVAVLAWAALWHLHAPVIGVSPLP